MIVSAIIIISTFIIIKNSIMSLINNSKYNFSIYLIIICIISIIVKSFLFFYINRLSKKYNNLLLKANAIEYRNDCIMTAINLISCILSVYNIYFIDSIVGILIALFTFFCSYKYTSIIQSRYFLYFFHIKFLEKAMTYSLISHFQ